jgi:hypothetical protein
VFCIGREWFLLGPGMRTHAVKKFSGLPHFSVRYPGAHSRRGPVTKSHRHPEGFVVVVVVLVWFLFIETRSL